MKLLLLFLALSSTALAYPVSRDQALAHISHYEGVRYVPYRDGPTHWSVGIGHQIRGRRKVRYTPTEVHAFFTDDLETARRSCRGSIVRFDALPPDVQLIALSVSFSCGPTGFREFTDFRHALSCRDYQRAARELERSRWSGQVGPTRARQAVMTLRSQR